MRHFATWSLAADWWAKRRRKGRRVIVIIFQSNYSDQSLMCIVLLFCCRSNINWMKLNYKTIAGWLSANVAKSWEFHSRWRDVTLPLVACTPGVHTLCKLEQFRGFVPQKWWSKFLFLLFLPFPHPLIPPSLSLLSLSSRSVTPIYSPSRSLLFLPH